MSRVRDIRMPDGTVVWFDTTRNGEKATEEQLELLATTLDEASQEVELDDVLDISSWYNEELTQGEVILRLREALGQGSVPTEIVAKRQKWREDRRKQPACRICGKEGDSTKHHFINKWILKELSGYAAKWADRTKNCIPLCIECHRDIHSRVSGAHPIAPYLTDKERAFAQAAIQALADEHPRLFILIGKGADSVYEARLIKDWIEGAFKPDEAQAEDGFFSPSELLELASK
jgi:hypothetical protein